MSQENQPAVENGEKIQLNSLDSENVAINNPVETSTNQDTPTTSGLIAVTTEKANLQDTSSVSNNVPDISIQNLPDVTTKEEEQIIARQERFTYINEKKYDVFLNSLKKFGGQICNRIIRIVTESRRTSDGKNYQDLYGQPIALFRKTYESLKTDNTNLFNEIKGAYEEVNDIDHITRQLPLPLQFILGIMLAAYESSIGEDKFVEKIRSEKNISLSTCYNYMKLVRIIEKIDDNRIFSIGLKNLYTLAGLLKDNQFGENQILENIKNLFYNLTNNDRALSNEDEHFTEDKFQLAVEYVIFYYKIGQPENLNRDEYGKLFDARYEWTKEDANFIKKHFIVKNKKGKYVTIGKNKHKYQFKDDNCMNDYMKKIIKNNFNGNLARNEILAITPQTTTKANKKSDNAFTINASTAHLIETIELYTNENKKVSPKELETLKNLQAKLNTFITQNDTQPNGVAQ